MARATSTTPPPGARTRCCSPRPAPPMRGCSPRAGSMRSMPCTKASRSTPSGITFATASRATPACASIICCSMHRRGIASRRPESTGRCAAAKSRATTPRPGWCSTETGGAGAQGNRRRRSLLLAGGRALRRRPLALVELGVGAGADLAHLVGRAVAEALGRGDCLVRLRLDRLLFLDAMGRVGPLGGRAQAVLGHHLFTIAVATGLVGTVERRGVGGGAGRDGGERQQQAGHRFHGALLADFDGLSVARS